MDYYLDDLKKSKVEYIYDKVKSNGEEFEELETFKHQEAVELMDEKYLFNKLLLKAKKLDLI